MFNSRLILFIIEMKVLKFGGTSVGTPSSLTNVKKIVESEVEAGERLIVVVSALGGVTDLLINSAHTASRGDMSYIITYAEIVRRHLEMIDSMVEAPRRQAVILKINQLLEELGNLYRGISLVRDLSTRTLALVVSYGERMSSTIISAVIKDAELIDSLALIVTAGGAKCPRLDADETDRRIKSELLDRDSKVMIAPGFISRDLDGDITNLGRGGSDFTAAIFGAALNASILEIWTDVDGFMSADPRIVKDARVIDSMTFAEAMELCNYGAKVIYPPTIYPVFRRSIPIVVKNTFNPVAPGTLIKKEIDSIDTAPVKGVSSVKDVVVISLMGTGVEMIDNFASRIYEALGEVHVEALLVSLVFNHNSVLVAVRSADAKRAINSLTDAFKDNLRNGLLSEIRETEGFGIVAAVGDNMSKTPGIAGRLSMVLDRENIPVVASTQGAIGNRAIFVVSEDMLLKALNTLHSVITES